MMVLVLCWRQQLQQRLPWRRRAQPGWVTYQHARQSAPACSSWFSFFQQIASTYEQTHRTPRDDGVNHPQRRWPGAVRPVVNDSRQVELLHRSAAWLSQLHGLNTSLNGKIGSGQVRGQRACKLSPSSSAWCCSSGSTAAQLEECPGPGWSHTSMLL